MRYYLGQINDQIGERKLSTTIRFTVGDEVTPAARLDLIAATWWGDDPDIEEEGYYFGGGEVWTTAGDLLEVSKETYDAMSLLISELS